MINDNPKALSVTTKSELPETGDLSLITEKDKYKQNYLLSRVKLPSIEITEGMRNAVEIAMNDGKKFIRLNDYTIMINSIAGIDPLLVKKPRKEFDPTEYENTPAISEEKMKQIRKQAYQKIGRVGARVEANL